MNQESSNLQDYALFPPKPEEIEAILEKARLDSSDNKERLETLERDDYPIILETICGRTDDSQPVEQYDGTLGVSTSFVSENQSPVCQVQWNDNLSSIYTNPGDVSGKRWGTGTMIADNIMITCGHLFDQFPRGWTVPRINGSSERISPQEIAKNMKVNFNYQVDRSGNLRNETSFSLEELIEYRLGELDMSICLISGNPGRTFGVAKVSKEDANKNDILCIIGHPAGKPKRIEAGLATSIDGDFIRYNDIDTLGGNSGSGILRSNNSSIVGIHTNGGCNPSSPSPTNPLASNYGLRITKFIDVSPTLQRLLDID